MPQGVRVQVPSRALFLGEKTLRGERATYGENAGSAGSNKIGDKNGRDAEPEGEFLALGPVAQNRVGGEVAGGEEQHKRVQENAEEGKVETFPDLAP